MFNKVKKVGITGQNGFVGKHLHNYLGLLEDVQLIEFRRDYFEKTDALASFVKECDVIIHLAAMNRHENHQVIYETNLGLVKRLIEACEASNATPWIFISSSTQERNDNLYGNSKKEGRKLLEAWAAKSGGKTTGMVIPNVFGPFGKPFYNSVTATFCYQIARGEEPAIINDGLVKLIYVNDLIEAIYNLIKEGTTGKVDIPHHHEILVSELSDKLKMFYHQYFEKGEFPAITDKTDLALFNTFRCYIPHDYYPRRLVKHVDDRGAFVEIVRANSRGQFSFSTTVPGITRGNHFHTRKAERFAVIKGKAKIDLRKIDTDEVISYNLDGDNPSYVDMPIWHTHNIKNTGDTELVTLFWINEPYNADDPDTYFINV